MFGLVLLAILDTKISLSSFSVEKNAYIARILFNL